MSDIDLLACFTKFSGCVAAPIIHIDSLNPRKHADIPSQSDGSGGRAVLPLNHFLSTSGRKFAILMDVQLFLRPFVGSFQLIERR